MERMLASGMTPQQVMEHFLKHGKTKHEEQEEVAAAQAEAEKRVKAGRNVTEEEQLELMKGQMGETERAEVEALLAQGVSLKDIMNRFMTKPSPDIPASDPASELRSLLERTDLSAEQKLELLEGSLTEEQRQEMEELLRSGLSAEQVLEQLARKAEAAARLEAVLGDPSLSQDQKLELLRGDMGAAKLLEVEELLRQGVSLEEALRQVARREAEGQESGRGREVSDLEKELREAMAGGLSQDQVDD